MVEFDNSSPMTVSTENVPTKKKRNLPGMPDPDSEVIALSPKTLMATNRFVCEICNKGFQRDQNLQLHRRGHNLPWKLRQRTENEIIRKKVYVCPEASCVHHTPSRALGDLTGIKKHFCRKHGEKKYKCERCSKKYAVKSDWNAHMKTCGSKEYKCDCGTLFSRRGSFITHRAFCDALADESVRPVQALNTNVVADPATSPPPTPLTPPPTTSVVSPGLSIQSSEMAENPMDFSPPMMPNAGTASCPSISTSGMFSSIFASSTVSKPTPFPNMMSSLSSSDCSSTLAIEPTSLSLASSRYLFDQFAPSIQPPALSATALLQKAAQVGPAASNHSLLRGLGLAMPSSNSSVKLDQTKCMGLGLGLASGDVMMMGQSSLFGSEPTTLDLLGLGIGIGEGGGSTGSLSALLNSFENVEAANSFIGGGIGGSGENVRGRFI